MNTVQNISNRGESGMSNQSKLTKFLLFASLSLIVLGISKLIVSISQADPFGDLSNDLLKQKVVNEVSMDLTNDALIIWLVILGIITLLSSFMIIKRKSSSFKSSIGYALFYAFLIVITSFIFSLVFFFGTAGFSLLPFKLLATLVPLGISLFIFIKLFTVKIKSLIIWIIIGNVLVFILSIIMCPKFEWSYTGYFRYCYWINEMLTEVGDGLSIFAFGLLTLQYTLEKKWR